MRERDVFAALDAGEIGPVRAAELLPYVEPVPWWETPAGVWALVWFAAAPWAVWGALLLLRWR